MARAFFIFRAKKKEVPRKQYICIHALRDGRWELKSVCGVWMVFFFVKRHLFEVSSELYRVDLLQEVDKCPTPSVLWWGYG